VIPQTDQEDSSRVCI